MGHSAGEVIRASDVADTFTNYTPTLSGWTLGNGTLTGKFFQQGDLIIGKAYYIIGSTDTISGNLGFSLPATGSFDRSVGEPLGAANLFDLSGGSTARQFWFTIANGTSTLAIAHATSGSLLNAITPYTWAAGDEILAWFRYEAA